MDSNVSWKAIIASVFCFSAVFTSFVPEPTRWDAALIALQSALTLYWGLSAIIEATNPNRISKVKTVSEDEYMEDEKDE